MPADANRQAMRFVAESTFGLTPATPTMKEIRYTSESLGQDTQTTTSQEIRADRQIADLVRTQVSASGDINGEVSYGAHDDFYAGALMSAGWSTPLLLTGLTLTFNAAGKTITRSTGSWISDGVLANSWIRPNGAINAGNNGYYKVVSRTATVITVQQVGLVDEVATAACGVTQGAQIVNGTTFQSFTIEKEMQDIANEFAFYRGMAIDQLRFGVGVGNILTNGFSFMGTRELSGGATLANAVTAATSGEVMNAVDDVRAILEGGAKYDLTEINLQLQNNLRARNKVGTLGTTSMGTGTVAISGSHRANYENNDVIDKYLNFEASSLAFVINKTGTTGAYVIDLPRVKYSNARRVAGGINQDILADLSYTAYRHPGENISIRMVRFD